MRKWKIIAVCNFFVPITLFMTIKIFTKWGADIENSMFSFLVGVIIQFILGALGIVKTRKITELKKECILFRISIFPMIIVIILYCLSKCYL